METARSRKQKKKRGGGCGVGEGGLWLSCEVFDVHSGALSWRKRKMKKTFLQPNAT